MVYLVQMIRVILGRKTIEFYFKNEKCKPAYSNKEGIE